MAQRQEVVMSDPAGTGPQSVRDRIVDALMAQLAERSLEQISLGDVARRAGVTLAELRNEFSSLIAIVGAHLKDIDAKVLSSNMSDMADETPREKLFDILMRRLEMLSPHKEAVRSLLRSAARNPALAIALNGFALRSMEFMLAAADISTAGPKGMVRAQGLALLYSRVLWVWLNDEDPGLARTMAALDRELSRGQRWAGFVNDICVIPEALCRGASRLRSRRRRGPDDETIAA
jgi:AcrR family transcriptional regulator